MSGALAPSGLLSGPLGGLIVMSSLLLAVLGALDALVRRLARLRAHGGLYSASRHKDRREGEARDAERQRLFLNDEMEEKA